MDSDKIRKWAIEQANLGKKSPFYDLFIRSKNSGAELAQEGLDIDAKTGATIVWINGAAYPLTKGVAGGGGKSQLSLLQQLFIELHARTVTFSKKKRTPTKYKKN